MKVLKFGGTSVRGSEEMQRVVAIIHEAGPDIAVVVSAMGGVTDTLLALGHAAANKTPDYKKDLVALKKRHLDIANATDHIDQIFSELEEILHGVSLIKELSNRTLDLILSAGERLSAWTLSEKIPGTAYVDMRELVKTNHTHGNALVDETTTYKNIQDWFDKHPNTIPIMTGFIGSTPEGQTTTIGRGGSDLTGSLVAAAMEAEVLEIWTDISGVMTANPKIVEKAFPIPHLSYNEMLEMSHFGAKVLHPPTVIPVMQRGIPILIKNTFDPEAAGTLIERNIHSNGEAIRGISSIDNVALMSLVGSGMVGVSGIATRLFGALAKQEISVIMISQCSSEHSICFAVPNHLNSQAKEAIEKEFSLEIQVNQIDGVTIENNMSILAVVGENLKERVGSSGRLFNALGTNGINVHAIAQGSSEWNITCVIKKEDEAKALNVIHEAFFLSPSTTLHLFIIGTGLIGGTLIQQISKQYQHLLEELSLDIRVAGIANSKKMLFDPNGIDLTKWNDLLNNSTNKMDLAAFIHQMDSMNLSNTIFVDCTASNSVADCYEEVIRASISVVTPNKRANSASYERYLQLRELSKNFGVKFYYETNVGAGLPIIGTIRNMRVSGDKILQIEGILSGTMSYLFNTFDGTTPFSETVRKAHEMGYTEPDPRDDLSGMDVVRKLLILVRESGYPLEIDEIEKTNFLPKSCFEEDDFYAQLRLEDENMKKRLQPEKKLRYVARFIDGKATVGLEAVDPTHPFYHVAENDNIIAVTSERYQKTPMVIKGHGAGAEVTAGEVFADIIRIGRNVNR